jgi:hypothetical protein
MLASSATEKTPDGGTSFECYDGYARIELPEQMFLREITVEI